MPDVIIHREGVAGRITLNRPQALHALNEEMCLTMDAALKAWADDAKSVSTNGKDTESLPFEK